MIFIFFENLWIWCGMKIICDWKNCKDVGSYKAPIEKKITVKNLDYFA